LTEEESRRACLDPALKEAIADELADVANIVFLLSAHTGIDLSDAVERKLIKNAVKYPEPAEPPLRPGSTA
jgi:NTP pyrophosphatase (non-canonical NTP hydrolase)